METMDDEKRCSQCLFCTGYQDCAEFQKVVELDAGLLLYRHKLRLGPNVDSSAQKTDVIKSILPEITAEIKSKEVFILQNIKDVEITSADFMPEFERKRVNCPRCQHIMTRAQMLLETVQALDRKDIRVVCDFCQTKKPRSACYICDKIAKKIAATRAKGDEMDKIIKKSYQVCVDEIQNNSCEVVEKKAEIKKITYSDLDIDKFIRKSPWSVQHLPDVDQLLLPERPKTIPVDLYSGVNLPTFNLSDEHDIVSVIDKKNKAERVKIEHTHEVMEKHTSDSFSLGDMHEFQERSIFRDPNDAIAVARHKTKSTLKKSPGVNPKYIDESHNLLEQKLKPSLVKPRLSDRNEDDILFGSHPLLRKYHSEESLITSFSGITEEILKKHLKYFFPQTKEKKKENEKSSINLIKETQNRILAETQEKKLKAEENDRKKIEEEQRKRVIYEEKRSINLIKETQNRILAETQEKKLKAEENDRKKIEEEQRKRVIYEEKKKAEQEANSVGETHVKRGKKKASATSIVDFDDETEHARPKEDVFKNNLKEIDYKAGPKSKKFKGEKEGELKNEKDFLKNVHDKIRETGEKNKENGDKERSQGVAKEKIDKQAKYQTEKVKEQAGKKKDELQANKQAANEQTTKFKDEKGVQEKSNKDKEPKRVIEITDKASAKISTKTKDEKGDKVKTGREKEQDVQRQTLISKDAKVNKDKTDGAKEQPGKGQSTTSKDITVIKQKTDKAMEQVDKKQVRGQADKVQTTTSKDEEKSYNVLVTASKNGNKMKENPDKEVEAGKKMAATLKNEKQIIENPTKSKDQADKIRDDIQVKEDSSSKHQDLSSKIKDNNDKALALNREITGARLKEKDNQKNFEAKEKSKSLQNKDKTKGGLNSGEKKTQKGVGKEEVHLLNKALANQEKEKSEKLKKIQAEEEQLRRAKEAAEKVTKIVSGQPFKEAVATTKEPPKAIGTKIDVGTKDTSKKGTADDIDIKSIKPIKTSQDDLILKLVKVREPKLEKPQEVKELPTIPEKRKKISKKKSVSAIDAASERDFDLESFIRKKMKPDDEYVHEIIIGTQICEKKAVPPKPPPETVPKLFKLAFTQESALPVLAIPTGKPTDEDFGELAVKKTEDIPKGIVKYALSDRTFIEKGWTMLPTEKVVRKMNVYRMHPSHPEFDWFEHHKTTGFMKYDTGQKLAEFDDDGRGRWFYKNGKIALNYYDCEEINAQQRVIIYSSGEPDERGRSRPISVLAMFDYIGNGIVFDHCGKIRLKYNQTEGVLLDREIGPVSHWKWHSLNDPPVLQQVMIDTHVAYKDPGIMTLGGPDDNKTRSDNEEMLAIEFDNFIKEKSKKSSQKFQPFQIKMKALKINEQFSLRVLDQASIYLLYREGSTNLKLNLGMVLDHQEIVDTDTAELGEVSNNIEKLPAKTDSLRELQNFVTNAKRCDRVRTERDKRLYPSVPVASVDQLTAPATRGLPPLFRTIPSCTTTNESPFKLRKPPANVLYYDTRLI